MVFPATAARQAVSTIWCNAANFVGISNGPTLPPAWHNVMRATSAEKRPKSSWRSTFHGMRIHAL
eukprot:scaffold133874_cov38-Prasinocladus_malaysianus.AAC.1